MKIDKVMNNNVVSSIDEDGQEIIVVGTGIGFQGKEGKVVDEKKIQKIFRLEDPKMIRKLKEILQDLPMEQFEISTAIIEHAKQSLGTELNENIYVTLTDHIHFAIQRYEDHMNFPNPMLREVRLFYEKEFALGEYALGMIKQRLNISLPLDDAASIALHIVSAEFDTRVKDTLKITEFLEDVTPQTNAQRAADPTKPMAIFFLLLFAVWIIANAAPGIPNIIHGKNPDMYIPRLHDTFLDVSPAQK